MRSALEVYLRNHDAAAGAGVDLFRRVASRQRDRPYGPTLGELRDEVVADARSLRRLLLDTGFRPDVAAGIALRVGERIGRLKPNGGLLRPTALADLIEVEGLTDAVQAKLAGWRALRTAGVAAPARELDRLIDRAEDQICRLRTIHRDVSRVLRPEPSSTSTAGQR